jgi:urate oxidase
MGANSLLSIANLIGLGPIALHCGLAGRPGRARALERFLTYACDQTQVWWATRADIARHWRAHFPPA